MDDLGKIEEFLENYRSSKVVDTKKSYNEQQINEMFIKDFMDYRRSIIMNEKLSARQKAMILAGMIGAGALSGGLTSCAQPSGGDDGFTQEAQDTLKSITSNISSSYKIYVGDSDSYVRSILKTIADYTISGAKEVTDYVISGLDTSTAGQHSFTISIGDIKATINIDVCQNEVTVSTDSSAKFGVGETIDPSKFTVNYDGRTATPTKAYFSDNTSTVPDKPGEKVQLTLVYPTEGKSSSEQTTIIEITPIKEIKMTIKNEFNCDIKITGSQTHTSGITIGSKGKTEDPTNFQIGETITVEDVTNNVNHHVAKNKFTVTSSMDNISIAPENDNFVIKILK